MFKPIKNEIAISTFVQDSNVLKKNSINQSAPLEICITKKRNSKSLHACKWLLIKFTHRLQKSEKLLFDSYLL